MIFLDSFDIVNGRIGLSSANLRPATNRSYHIVHNSSEGWMQFSMDFCKTKSADGTNSSTSTGRVSKQGRWRLFSLCVFSSSCVQNVVNEMKKKHTIVHNNIIQIRWERMRFWARAQFRRRCARENDKERDSYFCFCCSRLVFFC
jgi:hypothetical protein